MRLRRLVSILGILLLLPVVYFLWRDLYQNYLEKQRPTIRVIHGIDGFGRMDATLELELGDSGSGLEQLTVLCVQGDTRKEVFVKNYPQRITTDFVSVALNLPRLELKEGKARLIIVVADRSLWRNARREELDVAIDYAPPELTVLSTQYNVTRGGVGLVLFRAKDNLDIRAGVRLAEFEYQAFAAARFDPAFEKYPDIYFSFFAVPLEYAGDGLAQVFARDWVGNESDAAISLNIGKSTLLNGTFRLDENFFNIKIPELYNRYRSLTGNRVLPSAVPGLGKALLGERINQFRVVNEDFRRYSTDLLHTVVKKVKPERYWDGAFLSLPGSEKKSSYAEKRTYYLGEKDAKDAKELGASLHVGVDLASLKQADVLAANSGVVIFAGDLGVYGNTVILDHGFGLTSLYAHLSVMFVKEGARIQKSAVIGKTGTTGLAGGDHLHFEMRLFGQPVSPFEWWDEKWIAEHVTLAFRSVLDGLAGISEQPGAK